VLGFLVLRLAGGGGDRGGGAPRTPAGTTAPTGARAAEARGAVQDYDAALEAFAQRLDQAGGNDRRLAAAAADPPQLRRLDSADPAYVKARATAAAVTTTAQELRLVARERSKPSAHLSLLQYDVGADHWQEAFDRDNRRYDRLADILYADDGGFADTSRKDDLKVQRVWRAGVRQEIASFKRTRARMDKLETHNALERSYVEFALDEYDRSIAVLKEFATRLRQPPEKVQIGYYTTIATSQNGYHQVASAANRYRDGLERGFVRTVRRLAAGQPAAPGDAYRTAILSGFFSPLKKDKQKRRPGEIEERAWMLFRIRQLEHTPDESYDEARATLQLENIDDARNPYTGALQVYELHDLATDPKHGRLPLVPAYRRWAKMKLAQTFPPLLQPMVAAMDQRIQRYPTWDSLDGWHKVLKLDRQIERALRQGAKAADDPKQLKAALKDVLDATRPQAATAQA
jgi:hypothetical protein